MTSQSPEPVDNSSALYRRYRPQTFGEVVGQESVVELLTKQVAQNTPKHAYLFYGHRGCGKTSLARIFAKALNCLRRQDGDFEPCNECDSCNDITNGISPDVREENAALYSGVDAMRNVMSSVSVASPGKYKVYIFDEVHQISDAASDAFLKTLEEPPGNVIFILATTDLNKVKPTLQSRCLKRQFSLVDTLTLASHLTHIANLAGLNVGKDVITAAVLAGNGSVRDSLSALDSYVHGGTEETNFAPQLLNALGSGKLIDAFSAIAAASAKGENMRVLTEQTLVLLRECFLIQMNTAELVSTPDWGNRTALASSLGAKKTVLAMELLGEAVVGMRADFDARVNLEIAVARFVKMTA